MTRLADTLARLVTGHPWKALGASLLLVLGCAVGLVRPGLAFDAQNRIWFVEGDPTLEAYERLPRLFGDNKYAVVAVTAPSGPVVTEAGLQVVDAITRWLDAQPIVVQARSVTSFERILGSEELIEVERVWPLPPRYRSIDELRAVLAEDELVAGTLLSRDGASALVYARVETLDGDVTPYGALVRDLQAFLAGLDTRGHAVAISGEPVFAGWIQRTSMADSGLMAPLSIAIMAILLGVTFRRAISVWAPLAVIVLALTGTFGVMALLGRRLNLLNVTLFNILLPVCLAECIHLLSEFFRHYRGGNAPEAAARTVRALFRPFLFTTLTTVAGFLALCPSRLKPMRELGWEAAAGVAIAWLLSLVAFPALLARYRGRPVRIADPGPRDRSVRFAVWATGVAERFRWPIVAATAAATAGCLALLPSLRAETHNNDYFKADSAERANAEAVDRVLGGSVTLELVVDSGRAGGVKDPAFLRAMERLSARIADLRIGARPQSLVDWVKSIHAVLGGGRTIPSEPRQVSELLLAYESLGPADGLGSFRDPTERWYRLPVPMPSLSRLEYEQHLGAIEALARRELPGLGVEATGMVRLFTVMDRYILGTAQSSFAWSLAPIVLVLFAVLRSLRLGLLAILPNVLPTLLVGAVLVLLDVPLDFGTSMVAAIVLGIVVDDTIHFLSRLGDALGRTGTVRDAVVATHLETGGAIAISTLVVALGFGVYAFSSLVPNIRLGVFSSLVVTLACAIELFLTPALLFAFPPRRAEAPAPAGTLEEAA